MSPLTPPTQRLKLTEYMPRERVVAQQEQGGQRCTQAITHRTGFQFMEAKCLRNNELSSQVARALARYLIAREARKFQAANDALRKIGNHLESHPHLISTTLASRLPD